jgi:hypothetical protein
MALLRTITVLIARSRKRVDMTNNQARSDSDFQGHVAEVYTEMHEIVAEVGLRLFESSSTLTASGAASYALSSMTTTANGILHALRVARVNSDSSETPLDELMVGEEWPFKGSTGDATHFALVDHTLYLYPNPSSGTYKLYWVPQPTDYSGVAVGTSVDVLCSAGERFVVWGVAAIVHSELEGNASTAFREKERAAEDLRMWAAQRMLTNMRRRVGEDYMDDGVLPIPGDWPR